MTCFCEADLLNADESGTSHPKFPKFPKCIVFSYTVEGDAVICHEMEEGEDQGEAELQITAAVMDLTGDSDIEEAEPHDEDYSSYDDSDAVLG